MILTASDKKGSSSKDVDVGASSANKNLHFSNNEFLILLAKCV